MWQYVQAIVSQMSEVVFRGKLKWICKDFNRRTPKHKEEIHLKALTSKCCAWQWLLQLPSLLLLSSASRYLGQQTLLGQILPKISHVAVPPACGSVLPTCEVNRWLCDALSKVTWDCQCFCYRGVELQCLNKTTKGNTRIRQNTIDFTVEICVGDSTIVARACWSSEPTLSKVEASAGLAAFDCSLYQHVWNVWKF